MWRYWSVPAVLAFGSSLLYWQAPSLSRPIPAVQHLSSPRTAYCLAALDRLVAWDFTDLPLDQLPALLQKELRFPVVIDKKALEDASIGTDTLIQCHLHDVSAQAALRLTLRDIGLECILRDECLVITTKEEGDTALETRLYPVADLVQVYDEKGADTDYDSLIDVIVNTVAPNTWREGGTGEGMIRPCATAGTLVIAQHSAQHTDVERLLDRLRTLRAKQGMWGPVRRSMPLPHQGGFGGGGIPVVGAGQGSSGGFF